MENKEMIFIYILLNSLISFIGINGETISIKIIEEPVSSNNMIPGQNMINVYNSDNMNRRPTFEQEQNELKSKAQMKPAPFSGPSHLIELNGKCFDYISSNYKWTVCPFQNVTQYEQSIRWNPYKGIIGIWYEWNIENENRFESMKMLNGDECGIHGRRSANIYLTCGNTTKVNQINEPSTCKYKINLETPIVCDHNALLIYPYINSTYKHEWDVLYTDYKNNIITHDMYKMLMNKLFEKIGYYRSESDMLALKSSGINNNNNNINSDSNGQYVATNIFECQSEVNKLREQIRNLNSNLNTNKSSNV